MADGVRSQTHAAPSEFQAIMDAAVDAIVVIEADGRIAAFSRSAERMFGYAAAEMLGQPVSRLMPEPFRSAHSRYVESYCTTGEPRVIGTGRKVQAMRKDGKVFPVWISVGETRSGSEHRFVGIVRDLSDEQAAEHERRTLEIRLEHVSRLSLLGEMAAGIAHEINQPLAAIANYSQAAKAFLDRGQGRSDSLRTACEGIAEQVERAGDVIQNLRGFLRKREVEKTNLNLNKVVEDVMVLIKADAAHAGVDVQTKFAAIPEVRGNAVQLQQVILNLTHNAVDAMRQRSGRDREMRVETRRAAGGRVEVSVADSGPGISSSLGDAIFRPFFTTKQDGLGVGLAISRSIVDAHGGELTFQNRDEGGTEFIVSLPADE